jgi:uncharacterized protein (DUF885 family)
MVDSFIYIVKGSRVLDRTCNADWRVLRHAKESYANSHVINMADLRRYFSHRRSRYRDDLDKWFNDPRRLTVATLSEALKLADEAARGLIPPRIDVDKMLAADEARKKTPHRARVSI